MAQYNMTADFKFLNEQLHLDFKIQTNSTSNYKRKPPILLSHKTPPLFRTIRVFENISLDATT